MFDRVMTVSERLRPSSTKNGLKKVHKCSETLMQTARNSERLEMPWSYNMKFKTFRRDNIPLAQKNSYIKGRTIRSSHIINKACS